MPCFRPLKGYRSRDKGANGKYSIVFSPVKGFADLPLSVPCGQCIGCRLERSRQWAMRCIHEAQMHEENCFITLTYAPEHLPSSKSLVLSHFQKFVKRLRKEVSPKKIRFFHCGEYGEKLGRPHYHALIFGHDFTDLEQYRVGNGVVCSSKILSKLWPFGFNTVGRITFESAAYVARYITKKVTGKNALYHYNNIDLSSGEILEEKIPEYTTMSRRPGIGAGYFEKFKSDIFPRDKVIVRGKECKPPRFYDNKYELTNEMEFAIIKANRMKLTEEVIKNNTDERLEVREKYAELTLRKRSYENGK